MTARTAHLFLVVVVLYGRDLLLLLYMALDLANPRRLPQRWGCKITADDDTTSETRIDTQGRRKPISSCS